MTFEQFQATRKHCDDLGTALNDARWEEEETPATGYLYLGQLYIEDCHSDAAKARGKYALIIGNHEWVTNDLEALERKLYDFAVREGYTM